MKIFLFGQRNNLGGGTHFGGFVDAMKSLANIGELVEEVEASGKKSVLLPNLFNQMTCRFFSFLHCLNNGSKEQS